MAPPTSQKEAQNFIGVINYHCDMLSSQSHTLASLTKITYIKIHFEWTKFGQYAFIEIKRIAACDNLLTYPDFNETFNIHTDDSTFQ